MLDPGRHVSVGCLTIIRTCCCCGVRRGAGEHDVPQELVEVVPFGPRFAGICLQCAELIGAQVHDSLFHLENATHQEQWSGRDHERLPLKTFRGDDDVEDPRFVLEREKDESFGRAGALSADDEPGVGNALAVASMTMQITGGAHPVRREEFAEVTHRMAVQREPR